MTIQYHSMRMLSPLPHTHSSQATALALSALMDASAPRLFRRVIVIPRMGPCTASTLAAVPIATAVAVVWAVMRHEDWSWALQVWGAEGVEV